MYLILECHIFGKLSIIIVYTCYITSIGYLLVVFLIFNVSYHIILFLYQCVIINLKNIYIGTFDQDINAYLFIKIHTKFDCTTQWRIYGGMGPQGLDPPSQDADIILYNEIIIFIGIHRVANCLTVLTKFCKNKK